MQETPAQQDPARPSSGRRRSWWLRSVVLGGLCLVVLGEWSGYGWIWTVGSAPEIRLPDPRLEAAIRDACRKPEGPLTDQDLLAVTHLVLENVRTIRGIERCCGLQHLTCRSVEDLDLALLAGLADLRELNIHWGHYDSRIRADLRPLANLTGLRSLALAGIDEDKAWSTTPFDLAPLRALTQLQELHLVNLPQPLDLGPLAVLKKLEVLTVRWTRFQYKTQRAASPDHPESTRLVGLRDLTALSHLTRLRQLELTNTLVGDLGFLSGLSSLRVLHVTPGDVQDLRPLQDLNQLQWLELGCNRISDIRPLASLGDLRMLQLGGNRIDDISSLAGC